MSSPSENSPSVPPMIAGLLLASAYPHPVATLRLIETHISWVILAGDYAYKIKKPLDLGFLDFSSLDKRHFFCTEEIRLNQRLAPEIYLGLAAITGSPAAPQIDGAGPAFEWAVKMRAFPADSTLDRETKIVSAQIDAIAECIAEFHAGIAKLPAPTPGTPTPTPAATYGTLEAINEPVMANFTALAKLLPSQSDPALATLLNDLHNWTRNEGECLRPRFAARVRDGFVRECHGDLHLGNIAWVDGKPLIFDALEFNPGLRHIDVISEVAFLSMDLMHRDRPDLAWRLLNAYLDQTGDYHDGLSVLTYYQVYRAMVRAKVAAILASENTDTADFSTSLGYLRLASQLANQGTNQLTQPRRPVLLLMHGVSGSGKTWWSQRLLEQLGGLRLRSDVTRKRLFGLRPLQDSSAIPGGIYSREASERTLAALIDDARAALEAGFLVIVDATFIHRNWRAPFQALAEALQLDWHIITLAAPPEQLRARILQRQQDGADASEAGLDVLASQLDDLEPFEAVELPQLLPFEYGLSVAQGIDRVRAALKYSAKHQ